VAAVSPDNSPIPPQRAYDDSMRDLNQLRQSVQDDPDMAKQVQELIREMEGCPSRFPGNPALVEQLHTQVSPMWISLKLQCAASSTTRKPDRCAARYHNRASGLRSIRADYYRG